MAISTAAGVAGNTSPFDSRCTEVGVHSADREAWLKARRLGLGGSEVAALLGLNPFLSALEVYANKIGQGPANDNAFDDGPAYWGHVLEEPILRVYAARSGRDARPYGQLLRATGAPWLQVTPDGVQTRGGPAWAQGPGIVEAKSTAFADWHEEVPAWVQVQVQHEIMVCADWGTLTWLPLVERRLQWLDIAPHAEFQALLREKCAEFWQRVVEHRPPDADGSDSAKRALYALHPELSDECVALEDAEDIADEMALINDRLKALEDRKKLLSNRVLDTLGAEKVGLLSDGRYFNSWTVAERDTECPKCNAVTGTVKGFRACRLMKPRKSPHPLPVDKRQLRIEPDREIADLLRASLTELHEVSL